MGLASAALKEGQAAFAACVTAQPAMLSDIVSRLRSSLLSSARLSEGELLRCTDDLGPTTAQTAPHRVWRWNLTADTMPLGTGPGRLYVASALATPSPKQPPPFLPPKTPPPKSATTSWEVDC